MVDGVFTIRLLADPQPDGDMSSAPEGVAHERLAPGRPHPGRLNSEHREPIEFLAGPENRLAAVAVQSLLDERPSRYNPLVFYGPSGTGKTHLAHGLAQRWNGVVQHLDGHAGRKTTHDRQTGGNPDRGRSGDSSAAGGSAADGSVVYATAAEFSQSLNAAIDANTTAEFRRRMRGASLLVVEDLTQFASRRVAQQELVHTLDAILDNNGQAIFTSRAVPEKIPGLSPALCSRLASGLAVPLVPPAAAARLACIQRIAELRGVALPTAAARILATGLMSRRPNYSAPSPSLHLQSELDGQPIDPARVRRWLAERQLRLRPSLRTIARLSAKYFGLRVAEFTSPSRRRSVVQARAVAMYLARQLTGKSLEQVGTHFGGRDHTTVLHNCRSIDLRVRGDPTTRRAVADIRKMLAHA